MHPSFEHLIGQLDTVRIDELSQIGAATRAMRNLVGDPFGYRIAAAHDLGSRNPMIDESGCVIAAQEFGWGDEDSPWWRNSRLALDSPVTTACRYEDEPFWCNQSGIYPRKRNKFLDAISLERFEERALVRAAIVVPVHMMGGQLGAVSYCPLDPLQTDLAGDFQRFGAILGLYATAFVTSYAHVARSATFIPTDIELSNREVECLKWAGQGKTDGEIATILAISRSAVRYHITNIGRKFCSISRAQTILRASQLGYLASAETAAMTALHRRDNASRLPRPPLLRQHKDTIGR